MAQADSIRLWEALERDSASVCESMTGLAWLRKEQQEHFFLAPLGWEEFKEVHNCTAWFQV